MADLAATTGEVLLRLSQRIVLSQSSVNLNQVPQNIVAGQTQFFWHAQNAVTTTKKTTSTDSCDSNGHSCQPQSFVLTTVIRVNHSHSCQKQIIVTPTITAVCQVLCQHLTDTQANTIRWTIQDIYCHSNDVTMVAVFYICHRSLITSMMKCNCHAMQQPSPLIFQATLNCNIHRDL